MSTKQCMFTERRNAEKLKEKICCVHIYIPAHTQSLVILHTLEPPRWAIKTNCSKYGICLLIKHSHSSKLRLARPGNSRHIDSRMCGLSGWSLMKGGFMAQPAPYNQLEMASMLTRTTAPSLPSHQPVGPRSQERQRQQLQRPWRKEECEGLWRSPQKSHLTAVDRSR